MCMLCNCAHTLHAINPRLNCFESLLAEEDRELTGLLLVTVQPFHAMRGEGALSCTLLTAQQHRHGTKQL